MILGRAVTNGVGKLWLVAPGKCGGLTNDFCEKNATVRQRFLIIVEFVCSFDVIRWLTG